MATYHNNTSSLTSEIITTAVMTSIQGLTFKSSLFNPWDKDQPCPETIFATRSSASNERTRTEVKIRVRLLDPPARSTISDELPLRVVTLGQTL